MNILDHTFVVSSLDSVRDILLKIKNNKYPTKKSELDGSRFFKAYNDKFISIKNFDTTSKKVNINFNNQRNIDNQITKILFDNLLSKVNFKKYKNNKI